MYEIDLARGRDSDIRWRLETSKASRALSQQALGGWRRCKHERTSAGIDLDIIKLAHSKAGVRFRSAVRIQHERERIMWQPLTRSHMQGRALCRREEFGGSTHADAPISASCTS